MRGLSLFMLFALERLNPVKTVLRLTTLVMGINFQFSIVKIQLILINTFNIRDIIFYIHIFRLREQLLHFFL